VSVKFGGRVVGCASGFGCKSDVISLSLWEFYYPMVIGLVSYSYYTIYIYSSQEKALPK
jgi:hypothetical protein